MYVCMYVCMYVYVHVYVCMHRPRPEYLYQLYRCLRPGAFRSLTSRRTSQGACPSIVSTSLLDRHMKNRIA
jgi:hypothetical protein